VDVAVGVRRSVVQHERRPARVDLERAPVGTHLVPEVDPRRLPLAQRSLHREIGLRQVHRVLVVRHVFRAPSLRP
jgi:hypothetical protein